MIFDWKTEIHRYRHYFTNLRGLTEKKAVRSFTNLTLTLLTISFFGFFAIKPTLVIIASLVREIKDKQEINLRLKNKITDLVKAQDEYSLNQDRLYLLDQALPETPDFPPLIFALEREAILTGVQLTSFSISKIKIIEVKTKTESIPQKNSQIPSFEFNLSLTGEYQNLKEFLKNIENLRRSANFTSVSFAKVKQTGEEVPKIRLTILGKANFYPQKSKI